MKFEFGSGAIESSIPFISIHKMELLAKVNEHVQLRIWGMLKQQDAMDFVMRNCTNDMIKVTLSDGQVYFEGMILELEVEEQGGLYQICVTCVSLTFLLDIYPHTHSYQDVEQSYVDMLKKACREEKNTLLTSGKEAAVPIETPIFQYNETDWNFALRMTNKLKTYIVADYRVPYPSFILGETKGQTVDWKQKDYLVGHNWSNGEFYGCKSVEQHDLGERISLRGRDLIIVEKHSLFFNGEFENNYVLGTKEGYSAKACKHSLAGCRFRGTVLDTKAEKIKLHLEIDEIQEIDKAYWFEYVPQSGNIMYCMPQKGTKAMLRFCSDQDDSAVVEECWRENGQECPDISDYNKRYFTTEFGKRMAMFPKTMLLKGDGNKAELSERLGISLQSNHCIRIIGEQDVRIIAGEYCRLKVPKHIYITKPNTQSVMDFAGNEINIDSKNTNLVTTQDAADKAYSFLDTAPPVSISRSLAGKALAFAPKKSGRGSM